jgi:CRP/FNR family cyclic AMP-dependent transcriptional regulator
MDVLVMLAEQDPHLDLQGEISLQVTPQDVARWAGLSEADAQKELTHLSRTDKIELFGDKIVVKKIREFQRLVASRRKSMYQ